MQPAQPARTARRAGRKATPTTTVGSTNGTTTAPAAGRGPGNAAGAARRRAGARPAASPAVARPADQTREPEHPRGARAGPAPRARRRVRTGRRLTKPRPDDAEHRVDEEDREHDERDGGQRRRRRARRAARSAVVIAWSGPATRRSQSARCCGDVRRGRPTTGSARPSRTSPTPAAASPPSSTGKTYMLVGQRLLELGAEHEVDERLGALRVVARPSSTPAYSTWRKQVSSRALVVGRRLALRDRERRRGGVGQHDRPVAVAAAGGEVDLVGVGPAGVDLGAVGDQLLPVVLPAVVAVRRDGREQEGQAGRGGGRAGRDEQVPCTPARSGRRGSSAGRAVLREPGVVDVDADVAVVDRGELGGAASPARSYDAAPRPAGPRGVVGAAPLVDRAGGERVVDAVDHVARAGGPWSARACW